jgi:hypothetical protein
MDAILQTITGLKNRVIEEGVKPLTQATKNVNSNNNYENSDNKDYEERKMDNEKSDNGEKREYRDTEDDTKIIDDRQMVDGKRENKRRRVASGIELEDNDKSKIEHQEFVWDIIDHFFKDNPDVLVKHHLDSYNQFFSGDIKNILVENHRFSIINFITTFTC